MAGSIVGVINYIGYYNIGGIIRWSIVSSPMNLLTVINDYPEDSHSGNFCGIGILLGGALGRPDCRIWDPQV